MGEPLNPGATKSIKIAIHIWQDNSGGNNYPDNQATRDMLTEAIGHLDGGMWTYNDAPSHPLSGVPFIPDTKLRVDYQGVTFHQNSTLNGLALSGDVGQLSAQAINEDPEMRSSLLLHFVCPTCHHSLGSGIGGVSNGTSISAMDHWVVSKGELNPASTSTWALSQHWAHELGHNMHLCHTYGILCGETCLSSHLDYLSDVFEFPTDCWHDGAWECNIGDPANSCTNNMMGGTNAAGYYSPLQIGRIHRSLATRDVSKYAWGYSTTPYVVSNSETWDFKIKFYQDIIVPAGKTLTVKCMVEMVPQAKVVVQQGGRLIVDGGVITAAQYSGTFWAGIEIWGASNQHPFPADHPTYQGIVILKNGAVIEHAREAIQLWKPNDWNSIGGVVQVQGSSPTQLGGTFLNCRRAVTFMSYQNFHPSVPAIKRTNNSYFHYAHFEVDDDYRGGDDFYTHVSMLAVDGVQYRACIFVNSQTQVAQSSKIGYGIFSIDANYTVQGHCNITLPTGTPCPEQNLNRGKFIGLGQGIHALDGSTGRGFTADLLRFENNVVGVYTGDLPVFSVTRNQFVLGDRSVSMDRPEELDFQELYHRAISTQQSHGFRIEENTITAAPNITAQGIVGIVIENTGSNSTQVYLNSASDLDLGYVGEGHCIDVNSAFAVGHQFLCNTNSNNVQNVAVREDGTGGSDHGIRVFQGSDISPAMNTFDQEVGVLDESDFKNSTQWPVGYWHKSGQSEPLDVTTGWVVTLSASGTNNCPSLFESGPMKMGQAMVGQRTSEMVAAKEAWLNTSYVYASLIDGGNTPATVQQVQQSWPQDAWELRAQLMAKSPYLSTEVLMEMMKMNTLPQAMVLEICLANPEATKKEGFLKWAEQEASSPLPAYMADLIAGSWAEKTFRMELEAQMGQHHADMTLAADLLQVSFNADTMGIPVDSMLAVWQELPSYGARYGELRMHLRSGQFTDARNVLNSLSANYPMREGREQERDRALWFIDRLESLHGEGRSMMQLDSGEVGQLRSFALAGADIPAGWARNILCFGYSICLPPPGGTGGDNKTLNPVSPELSQSAAPLLRLMPNPAAVAVSIVIEVPGGLRNGHVRILDMSGREVARLPVDASPQQLVWDTRQQATGAYHVELFGNGERLATERLIIQAR